jgi:hypothetical protein
MHPAALFFDAARQTISAIVTILRIFLCGKKENFVAAVTTSREEYSPDA